MNILNKKSLQLSAFSLLDFKSISVSAIKKLILFQNYGQAG